ncbi:glycosidase [Spirochaetia bacterium]|nr:glycosidase [Spirochaetia bacterium]
MKAKTLGTSSAASSGQPIAIKRLAEPNLQPDHARVVLRPFVPLADRILPVITRVDTLSDALIEEALEQVQQAFGDDHRDLLERFREHCALAESWLEADPVFQGCPLTARAEGLSPERRLLIGAYFTSEYAFEATALFNPSIVAAPEQEHGETAETLRFIMSTRSVGEGHVSSVSFRTGRITKDGAVCIDPVGRTAVLGTHHTIGDGSELQFDASVPLSERLIFPIALDEQNGIEDARFVRFTDEYGDIRYYATYTAYDGKHIRSKMLETDDFLRFTMRPLGGALAQNKGMALFPRKIRGRYAMLSRMDGESLYIAFSENLHVWNEGIRIAAPAYPWEFTQIGNCGSPLELPEGWLVLTHGVGSLRRYSIGALLLDKEDPTRVIGRLTEPLISPGERERMGYVPNVVYTCGSIIHRGRLIIPYGSADFSIAFITVGVDELLGKLRE